MKISLNSIKWQGYQALFDLPIDKLAKIIGSQLGALEEEPLYLGKLYDGVVVAKIVKCLPHPNADKLQVCAIDDGGITPDVNRDDDGLIQVVCGAPNARENLTVAWLPPGSTVPSSAAKDPFVLEARELRGIISNGMLASPHELAISDDHTGILEITAEDVGQELIKPGTPFKKLYGLDDYILEIENKMFTHRPDCFGLLGVGREIAGIQSKAFTSPDWYLASAKLDVPSTTELELSLRNELPELVPRFVAVPISGVSVRPSPPWLQSWLNRSGVRSINNLVDLTNYYMLLTGQPLHAYDYDKLKKLSSGEATIVVRHPKKGEKITLLGGKQIAPRQEAIMIATDKQLIGVGGVMGGNKTEVDEQTTNIVLECANFDMYSIRRTSMAHGLFTDASTRFNKGQSPLQNMVVAAKAVTDIINLAGGAVAGQIIDENYVALEVQRRNALFEPVKTDAQYINDRLGTELGANDIKKLLENVEFTVELTNEILTIKAPFWRTDIEIPEDIVEEVGRLYGYDKLPLELPKLDLTPAEKDPLLETKVAIRDHLSKGGANELLTYSFVHGNLLDKVGQDRTTAFQIANALSPDLQYYRLSLLPSLLDKVHQNVKAGYGEFALFELGKIQLVGENDQDGLPDQLNRIAFVYTASKKQARAGAPFYQAKYYAINLMKTVFGINQKDVILARNSQISGDTVGSRSTNAPFNLDRSWSIAIKGQNTIVGTVGEFKGSVRASLKLPDFSSGFELDIDLLEEWRAKNSQSNYEPLPRFPSVKQDITLKVSADLPYQALYECVEAEITNQQPKDSTFSLKPLDIYQSEVDTAHKNVTLGLSIASFDRTLTDGEINKLLDRVADHAKAKLNAERI